VDDQDPEITVSGERRHHAAQEMTVLALTAARAVGLASRVRLADEGDAGGDAIGAECALQPGRVTQLADGDTDIAVCLVGYRPGRQLRTGGMAGLMARWQQQESDAARSTSLSLISSWTFIDRVLSAVRTTHAREAG
jgi:hypothetical protein